VWKDEDEDEDGERWLGGEFRRLDEGRRVVAKGEEVVVGREERERGREEREGRGDGGWRRTKVRSRTKRERERGEGGVRFLFSSYFTPYSPLLETVNHRSIQARSKSTRTEKEREAEAE